MEWAEQAQQIEQIVTNKGSPFQVGSVGLIQPDLGQQIPAGGGSRVVW